jgi:hypothetical protein
MREAQWQSDKFTSIVVLFPDEAKISSDQDLLQFRHEPTVRLDKN